MIQIGDSTSMCAFVSPLLIPSSTNHGGLIPSNVISFAHWNFYSMPPRETKNDVNTWSVLSDTEPGCIHNVTPVRKSKSNHHWHEFQPQISSDVKRVVAFIPFDLRHYEQNKVPVQLKNLMKEEDCNCFFNKQSVSILRNCEQIKKIARL